MGTALKHPVPDERLSRHLCHGRFVGPMFSIVGHPVYYHFATLLAFVAPISSRLSQLRSLTPVCLGPPENCKLPSRSRDVIVRERLSELKKEIRKYVSLASIELKLSWPQSVRQS